MLILIASPRKLLKPRTIITHTLTEIKDDQRNVILIQLMQVYFKILTGYFVLKWFRYVLSQKLLHNKQTHKCMAHNA